MDASESSLIVIDLRYGLLSVYVVKRCEEVCEDRDEAIYNSISPAELINNP